MSVHGVLLDVDGTLLDSNAAHTMAFVRAFEREGIDVTVDRVRPLIGMGSEKLLPTLGVEPTSPTGKRIERGKSEIFMRDFLPTLRPFPAARNLLERMKSRGLERIVATSAKVDEMAALLRQAGLDDLIDASSSADDAKASKPSPDIVEAAIARAKSPRGELVMLGDTPYDVEAARRAGVSAVALRSGGWSDASLGDAVEIYEDVQELLARYEESIFARR